MKGYLKNRTLSQSILLFTAFTLFINTTSLALINGPEEKQSTWYKKAWGSVKETFSDRLIETLKTVTGKAKSEIKSSVAKTYERVKNFDKATLFSQLKKSLYALGTQMGDIKDCMLFGTKVSIEGEISQCSATKRAAFYATAITVLALTAAVVGFTITIAATSKEPDKELANAVEQTSQEVVGWKPEAIFLRLKNKIASFEDTLTSMEQCLITRKCTKKQKIALYVTAATIVALVTIVIGVDVGSYIYAQKRKAQELTKAVETDIRAEKEKQLQAKIDAATTEAERLAAEEELKKFLEMGNYDDNPAPATGFQALVQKYIKTIKNTPTQLKEAYKKVETGIKEGVIRSRAKAAELFQQVIDIGNNFETVIQSALDVNLQETLATLKTLKEQFAIFDKINQDFWISKLGNLGIGVLDIAEYMQEVAEKFAIGQKAFLGYDTQEEKLLRDKLRELEQPIKEQQQTRNEQQQVIRRQRQAIEPKKQIVQARSTVIKKLIDIRNKVQKRKDQTLTKKLDYELFLLTQPLSKIGEEIRRDRLTLTDLNAKIQSIQTKQETDQEYIKEQEEKLRSEEETLRTTEEELSSIEREQQSKEEVQKTKDELTQLKSKKLVETYIAGALKKTPEDFKKKLNELAQDKRKLQDKLSEVSHKLSEPGSEKYKRTLLSKKESLERQILFKDREGNLVNRQEDFAAVFNISFIEEVYATLARKINKLNLYPLGTVAEEGVNTIAGAMKVAKGIHKGAGKIGIIISPQKVQNSFQQMADGLYNLARYLKAMSVIKDPIEADAIKLTLKTIPEAFASLGWEAMKGTATGAIAMRKEFYQLKDKVLTTVHAGKRFKDELDNFIPRVKEIFNKQLFDKKKTLYTIAHAPQIMLIAVGQQIKVLRKTFSQLIAESTFYIQTMVKMLPEVFKTFENINSSMKAISGKEYIIKPEIMEEIRKALLYTIPNVQEGFKGIMEQFEPIGKRKVSNPKWPQSTKTNVPPEGPMDLP